MEHVNEIIGQFLPHATVVTCEPYGHGHINQTFRVTTQEDGRFILQRINTHVFPNVDALMHNVMGVTKFLYRKRLAAGDPPEEVLKLLLSVDGAPYVRLGDGCYRLYNFIENALDTDAMQVTPDLFRLSGVGFGRFQSDLAGYPVEKLTEPIPDFHNTRARFNALDAAVRADAAGRREQAAPEIAFYLARGHYADRVIRQIKLGRIPLRVTHNDTKLNNVLIDATGTRVLSIIDLDTVMPGSILYDFGDSIRFGASTAAEDEPDLKRVHFDVEMFRAFCEGFLPQVSSVLTNAEVDEMAFGALLMTYECGMRFLTDFLMGDAYFRTTHPTHNLERARTQMKLVCEMEAQLPAMNKIVAGIARSKHIK